MFQAEEAAEVKALWGKELFSAPFRVQKKERAQEGCRGAGRNGQCPPEHQIKPEHLQAGRAIEAVTPSTASDIVSRESITCLSALHQHFMALAQTTLAALRGLTGWQGKQTRAKQRDRRWSTLWAALPAGGGWEALRMGRVCTCWDGEKGIAAGGGV